MKSSHAVCTVDELVALLKKTRIPTVIIEGRDDVIVFRILENDLAQHGVSFIGVGGRETLLKVYERRGEFAKSKVAFIADKDAWVFSNVPGEFAQSIKFTDGYSIENDMYRDGELDTLMSAQEHSRFCKELNEVSGWFAAVMHCRLKGEHHACDLHPNQLLTQRSKLRATYKKWAEANACPSGFQSLVEKSYSKFLRGKTLWSLLLRQLSHAHRPAKYSAKALLEIAATRRGAYLMAIDQFVRESFAIPSR